MEEEEKEKEDAPKSLWRSVDFLDLKKPLLKKTKVIRLGEEDETQPNKKRSKSRKRRERQRQAKAGKDGIE